MLTQAELEEEIARHLTYPDKDIRVLDMQLCLLKAFIISEYGTHLCIENNDLIKDDKSHVISIVHKSQEDWMASFLFRNEARADFVLEKIKNYNLCPYHVKLQSHDYESWLNTFVTG